MKDPRSKLAIAGAQQKEAIVYTTTEGRQRFPDILQVSYGDKAVIGFDRYGRALGAVVPMEAVRVLAGFPDTVDPDIIKRIERTAKRLIERLPEEAALCGLKPDPELKDLDSLEVARRKKRTQNRKKAKSEPLG